MKYVSVVLAFAVALFPAGAFAACPDENGPYQIGNITYYTFTFDTSCASTSGDVETSTLSCYNWAAYEWDPNNGSVDYSMTVPTGRGGSHWSVSIYVDFDDPHAYQQSGISATVYVWHNASLSSYETFFTHNGNQGSLSCNLFGSSEFSVQDGDTVEVSMTGANYYYDTTMKISTPIIFTD